MDAKRASTSERRNSSHASNEEPRAQGARRVLPISKIITGAGTQVRAEINDKTVTDYAEHLSAGGEFPPITVFEHEDRIYLADGFHRLRAHERVERTEIEAEIRTGTREDALWWALGANRAHGERMTWPDKKRSVELALEVWPERSQRRIAAQIGCSVGYVNRIRQVFTSEHLPDRTVGEDGKSYPAARQAAEPEPRNHDDKAERGAARHETPARVEADEPAEDARDTEPKARPSQRAQNRSNRIVSVVATDALNLTAQEELIDFRALDHAKLPEWIGELEEARRRLGRLIRRLKQEVGGENANDEA